jgi:predicted Rossmann fold nucleotide-binding protein DprA/Smf involved in DNA uptake
MAPSKPIKAGKRPVKSVGDQAVARIGKRPITAPALAAKMGLKGHQPIARKLSQAEKQGLIIKTDKGYTKA